MSDNEKALTDAYYWLSMYKSGATTEGVAMEKVKEAIFDQPQLNDNQQALVIWMQDNECSADDPLESISDLFLEGTPSEYFPDAPLSCVEAAYQSLNKKQKLELVQEYVKKALEQEEE
ncbi:hypothetical protein [Enterococcus italicus]|uniref:hypothetical protein n=1 Tax=Enterococcus italicus TaxID=246144 RepID=UPI003F46A5DB